MLTRTQAIKLAVNLVKPRRHNPYSPMRQTYTILTERWHILSLSQRTAYGTLGKRMNGASARRPLTGYQAYLSLNTARQALKLEPLADAPPAPEPVAYLSNLTVRAVGPAHGEPQPGPFRLTVHADPIDTPLQVFIAVPMIPQDTLPSAQKFKALGVIDGIGADGTDITGLYQIKYRGYEQGYMIAVRLVPLSANGFRGQAVSAMGTIAAP